MSMQYDLPKGVNFYKQFPRSLLRPYGQAIDCSDDDGIIKYLKPFNCELLLRPNVFFSEFNSALAENCQILKDDLQDPEGLLNEAGGMRRFLKANEKLQKKMAPLSKFSTQSPSKDDVLKCLCSIVSQDDESDRLMDEAFKIGNAFFSIATHHLAARTLLRNPEKYAEQVQTVSGNDWEFKKHPTLKSMAKFLTAECVRKQQSATLSNKRQMSAQLLSMLDESSIFSSNEEAPQPRQRQRPYFASSTPKESSPPNESSPPSRKKGQKSKRKLVEEDDEQPLTSSRSSSQKKRHKKSKKSSGKLSKLVLVCETLEGHIV